MKRWPTATDSLDLLLGPMCNTFGILVLVACITALFANQSRSAPVRTQSPVEELFARRLKNAEADQQKLQEMVGDEAAPISAERTQMLADLDQLRQALEALRKQAADLEKKISRNAASLAVDPGLNLRKLKDLQRELQREVAALQNMLPALEAQIAAAETRAKAAAGEKAKVVEARTVRMRFPREHTSSLQSFPVLLKYGKFYPLALLGKPNPDVQITSLGEDKTHAEPLRDRGWQVKPDNFVLLEFLRDVKEHNAYLSIYVFTDSFEESRQLRQIIVDHGVEFGLMVVTSGEKLFFSSKGSAPPPL